MDFDIQATPMSSSTDVPFNGVNEMAPYQHALAYYAAAMMNMIENVPARATAFQQVWGTIITGMTKRCLEAPSYLPSAAGAPN